VKQQDPAVMIALGVYRLLVFGLLIGTVVAFLLLPVCGRALRRATVAGSVPVAMLLRRLTGRWPAEEAINTPSTACLLALIPWSSVGVLIGGALALLGAHPVSLLIGVSTGLLIGALCSLGKEPQPQRPQTVDDLYPPGWCP
jgi:hypothetical protein